MHELIIRQFDQKDKEAVIDLWHDCALVVPLNNPAVDIDQKVAFQPAFFYVGELDKKIVATVMAGYEGHRGWLNYLSVLPQFRQRGYGSAMVKYALARLKEIGCPKVNLMVRKSNLQVCTFYEKLGFQMDDVIGMGYRF